MKSTMNLQSGRGRRIQLRRSGREGDGEGTRKFEEGKSKHKIFFPETGGENGSLIQSGVEGSGASAVQRPGRHPSDSEWPASLAGGNGRDESTVEIV
jgi:hypothetical protein